MFLRFLAQRFLCWSGNGWIFHPCSADFQGWIFLVLSIKSWSSASQASLGAFIPINPLVVNELHSLHYPCGLSCPWIPWIPWPQERPGGGMSSCQLHFLGLWLWEFLLRLAGLAPVRNHSREWGCPITAQIRWEYPGIVAQS